MAELLNFSYKSTDAREDYISKDGSKRGITISPRGFSDCLESERVGFSGGKLCRV